MIWVREIIGWLLVVFAIFLIYYGMTFAMDLETPRLVEAGILTFAGLSVLRAGIYLVRVATAARIFQKD